jgi:hypothetical protein
VNFARVLKEVLWCLVTEGSISYRRIKLTFGLDDDGLEELRSELIGIKRGMRRNGKTGAAHAASCNLGFPILSSVESLGVGRSPAPEVAPSPAASSF